MSWVSQANIKTIMTAIRNKFTTGDLVIANDAKDTGVELNHASQDGLVTVSPISTSASTEAALHLSNGDDTKKTELTQGTLSYVTGSGSSEKYNYMSLLGDGVTFGKNGGGNVQLGGVADPTSAQQVATKNYVDSMFYTTSYQIKNTTTRNIDSKANYNLDIRTIYLPEGVKAINVLSCSVTSIGTGGTDLVPMVVMTRAFGYDQHLTIKLSVYNRSTSDLNLYDDVTFNVVILALRG